MTDLFDLTGKAALVTGGNGGIGLGMADGLAAAGASVCIWGRNPEKNAAAVDVIGRHGSAVAAFSCDVADEEQIAEVFAASVARFGGFDACFANAGIGFGRSRFTDMTSEEWRAVLSVNLDGVFHTFRAVVRDLVERGTPGSLVAVSSIASRLGVPRGEHYAASKAAVTALVRSIAVEYGRKGIRANAVLPGWVATAMTEEQFSDDRFAAAQLPRISLGRWGEPDDLAGIAVYLASDASRWHTGTEIVVDGGFTVD